MELYEKALAGLMASQHELKSELSGLRSELTEAAQETRLLAGHINAQADRMEGLANKTGNVVDVLDKNNARVSDLITASRSLLDMVMNNTERIAELEKGA